MQKGKILLLVGGGLAVAALGATALTGAALAAGSPPRGHTAVSATTGTPGSDSVVAACQAVFASAAPVTGPESFVGAQQDAAAAAHADPSWVPFQTHLDTYVDAYLTFKNSGWSTGVVEAGEAQETLAADCATVGVIADAD